MGGAVVANEVSSRSTRESVAVSDLEQGARFYWRDAEWEADVQEVDGRTRYIDAYREGGFGSRVTFYDPLTAAKAGELSWATRVERA